jgi:o-succinylbenzoate synthase
MKKIAEPARLSPAIAESEYSFSWRVFTHEFARPLETAHGIWRERRGIVIRLENRDGKFGLGEMSPLSVFDGSDMATCIGLCESLGAKTTRIGLSKRKLPSCARFAFGSALAMIDGKQPRRGRWPLSRLLPRGSGALFEASKYIRAGCRCFKYKVTGLPDEGERNIIEMLFETLHAAGGRLRVDANGCFSPEDALAFAVYLKKVSKDALDFLEQPLACGKEGAMLEIMRQSGVEIALDESVAAADSLREWLFWQGPLVVKPAIAGDPIETAKLLDARRGRVILSSAMESPVGLWGSLMAIGERVPEPLGFGIGVWSETDAWGESTSGASLDSSKVTRNDTEAVWNGLRI